MVRVFLIGFMGCGKSFKAKLIAEKLAWTFVDLDGFIEEREKMTIPDLFRRKGEVAFRRMEYDALRALANRRNIIVATGGGTPCTGGNMDWILDNGTSFYIRVPAKELAGRLKGQQHKRPLLDGISSTELYPAVRQLLEVREPYYLRADHIIPEGPECVDSICRVIRSGRSI